MNHRGKFLSKAVQFHILNTLSQALIEVFEKGKHADRMIDKYMRVNKFMLRLIGLFQKVVMGTVEMYYQYNHDYIFDSSKFEKAFNFKPTSYKDGIKEMAKSLYKC